MRRTLVAALVSCAGQHAKARLLRFLAGLSADELEFLAGFQGARILEGCTAAPATPANRPGYSCDAPETADHDHKMLVLREYLARCSSAASERDAYFGHTSTGEGRSAAGLA